MAQFPLLVAIGMDISLKKHFNSHRKLFKVLYRDREYCSCSPGRATKQKLGDTQKHKPRVAATERAVLRRMAGVGAE